MAEITGIVQDIITRSVAGGKTSYDIVVAGEKYGAGLYAPKCQKGDYVKFELDDSRGYKNVGRNSLKVSKNKPPAEAVAEAAATVGKQDQKQETISRQSALNSAIAFMTLLSANEALGLPAATAKGKRQEVLEAMLEKYVAEFYESNTGVKYKSISPSAPTDAPADEAGEAEEVETPADSEWE